MNFLASSWGWTTAKNCISLFPCFMRQMLTEKCFLLPYSASLRTTQLHFLFWAYPALCGAIQLFYVLFLASFSSWRCPALRPRTDFTLFRSVSRSSSLLSTILLHTTQEIISEGERKFEYRKFSNICWRYDNRVWSSCDRFGEAMVMQFSRYFSRPQLWSLTSLPLLLTKVQMV